MPGPHSDSISVCVCVCVCEREREREQAHELWKETEERVAAFTGQAELRGKAKPNL